jgi:regulator of sigma E protease
LEILSLFWNIFKVAFGLGFVIFIHELGHFLLAKWNDVKVEKFSIGFGPTLFGFRRGETEYVLAAVPLGGFVKMLGEGPDEEASKSTDPRAFTNKTVGARMAIISAGVIMNVILGLGCFVYAYGHGMDEMPARVGAVIAGSPAYVAGIHAGDEILTVDGRGDLSFNSMNMRVLLSGKDQTLHFEVRRPGHDLPIGMDIQPRREAGSDRPTIGVGPSSSLNVGLFDPPAGMKAPPEYPRPEVTEGARPVETLVAVGPPGEPPTAVEDFGQYARVHARYPDKDLVHVIQRREGPIDEPGREIGRFEITLPPAKFVDFGARLTIEPISGVQKNSPADRAGFRKGDRIVRVDGSDDFDPMRLPSEVYEKAGKPMTFDVDRPATDGTKVRQTITVTPDDTPPWTEPLYSNEALEVPGLGLCYPVTTHVVGVAPDSPAARAGLKPGDVINSMTFPPHKPVEPPKASSGKSQPPAPKPETITFDDASPAWVKAFWLLQTSPSAPVSLVVNKASSPIELTAQAQDKWYFPSRGLLFIPLFRKLPPQEIGAALRRGWDDTVENIMGIYAMFRSLYQGQVGPGGLAGPLRIMDVAYQTAQSGMTYLVHFLGILSINLAVINFLPIPPLDGGQMLFLAAEKVRGRPLPDSALSAGILVGIVLVICLMVFVTYQDISWYIKNWTGL